MPARTRTVLITGAAGFVGRHLCRYLADAGWRVRAAVRTLPATPLGRDGLTYRAVGNMAGPLDWAPVLAGVEAVVHAAARVHVLRERAQDPLEAFRRANVTT
ncbi:MAG: NAD-dependent epimerase/dehydratase family protein, partial [Alphaproteobacteria bacterium]